MITPYQINQEAIRELIDKITVHNIELTFPHGRAAHSLIDEVKRGLVALLEKEEIS